VLDQAEAIAGGYVLVEGATLLHYFDD